jgi:hypothetical protein
VAYVRLASVYREFRDVSEFIDELIEEGKITSTIEHFNTLPDDEWLMPVGCYNLWEDKQEKNAITCVRIYLGVDLGFETKSTDLLSNVDFMNRYAAWLQRNEEGLLALVNLKDAEDGPEDVAKFTPKEIAWIESRDWFQENLAVSVCLNESIKAMSDPEGENINRRLLVLYNTDARTKEKYKEKIIETERELSELPIIKRMRTKLNAWLDTQDGDSKIQEVLSGYVIESRN